MFGFVKIFSIYFSVILYICTSAVADIKQNEQIKDYLNTAYSAYIKGNKREALKLWQLAADIGSVAAYWQLATFYKNGEIVAKDPVKAFKLFKKIIDEPINIDAPESVYLSDALVNNANYLYTGIPNSSIEADLSQARLYYYQAASLFANGVAQYRLALMMLKGEGGKEEKSAALKWLQLSANKCNPLAQATLGNILFNEGDAIYGLFLLMKAAKEVGETDKNWVNKLKDNAIAKSSIEDQNAASSLVEETFYD